MKSRMNIFQGSIFFFFFSKTEMEELFFYSLGHGFHNLAAKFETLHIALSMCPFKVNS